MLLSPTYCLPPPNLFPSIAHDPSVAVWRLSLGCALLLGAETLLLRWRVRTLRAALLPLAGTVGCLALAIAAWIQSLTFIQDVCATSLALSGETGQRILERAHAALHLNQVYQDLTVAALVVTLVLLVWGGVWLALPPRRPRAA
jgi:hypothetical protein